MTRGKRIDGDRQLIGVGDVAGVGHQRKPGRGKIRFDEREAFDVAIEQPECPAIAPERTRQLESQATARAGDEGTAAWKARVQAAEFIRHRCYLVRGAAG